MSVVTIKFPELPSARLLKNGLMMAVLIFILPLSAHARDKNEKVFNLKHHQECGACHVAFSPVLLNANSWRAVMAGLDKHFGFDVSLDKAEVDEIESFLVRYAGKRKTERDGKP